MATTLKQDEGIPEDYPAPPAGLSTAAAALGPDFIWQRIEGWIAHRWGEREVIWIAEGPGHWEPPLLPATVTKAEVWRADDWEELTLPASPLGGFRLGGEWHYRFTATVGEDEEDVPAAVLEAFRRLAEYLVEREFDTVAAGASSFSATAGAVSMNFRRNPAYMARALENSGAADLLRPWRRA